MRLGKTILLVIINFFILSPLYADLRRVGSPEMFEFFASQGVEYAHVHRFVESFDADDCPGGDLVTDHPDPRVTKIAQGDWRSPMMYIAFDHEIGSYGLFAFGSVPAGTILGIYSGEVQFSPIVGVAPIAVPIAREEEIRLGGGIKNFRNLFFASWLPPGQEGSEVELTFESHGKYAVPLEHPFHSQVSIRINAFRHGNELRFINHAPESEANAGFRRAFILYEDFLAMSGKPEWIELAEGIKDRGLYMPVVLVQTLRNVGPGEQFAIDYGEGYWRSAHEAYGISPRPLTKRIAYQFVLPDAVRKFLAGAR